MTPPADQSAAAPIPKAQLRAARRRLYRKIMALLHLEVARTGRTYGDIARRLGWTRAKVKRAFYSEKFWRRKRAIEDLSDLLLVIGAAELEITAMPAPKWEPPE